ncbi:MAG: hypothetical protein HC780_22410 [Leptolyngbyaceae cyanobacterium CSU_1_3]|nr:hypothetical protein [Leptolyngbyaceae cyanobacterium CSU_1_3]
MSLDLTIEEMDDMFLEAEQQCPPATSIDRLETIYTMPPPLGSGYHRDMELHPGLELSIFNATYHDVTVRVPENEHLVQFMVHLSGVIDSGDFLYQDANQSYIGGSGIQRAVAAFNPAQLQVGVDIHMEPHLLSQFLRHRLGNCRSSYSRWCRERTGSGCFRRR